MIETTMVQTRWSADFTNNRKTFKVCHLHLVSESACIVMSFFDYIDDETCSSVGLAARCGNLSALQKLLETGLI